MSTHSQESRSDPHESAFRAVMQKLKNEKCPRSRHRILYQLTDLFKKPEELVELYNEFASPDSRDIIVRVIRSRAKAPKLFESRHFNPAHFKHWSRINACCTMHTSRNKVDPMELFSLHMMLATAKRIKDLASLFHALPATRHSSVYEIRQKTIALIVSRVYQGERLERTMRAMRSYFQEEEWRMFEHYRKAA